MVIKRSSTVPPVPSHLEKWGARAPPRVRWFRCHCYSSRWVT